MKIIDIKLERTTTTPAMMKATVVALDEGVRQTSIYTATTSEKAVKHAILAITNDLHDRLINQVSIEQTAHF